MVEKSLIHILLKEGMKVHIDSKCEKTARTYGINDNMRDYFFGKECIIDSTPLKGDSCIKVKGIESSRTWSFCPEDINTPFVGLTGVEKPVVKKVTFDPNNL